MLVFDCKFLSTMVDIHEFLAWPEEETNVDFASTLRNAVFTENRHT